MKEQKVLAAVGTSVKGPRRSKRLEGRMSYSVQAEQVMRREGIGSLRTWTGRLVSLERGWSATAVFLALLATVAFTRPGNIPMLINGLIFLIMCYGWNLVGGFLGEMSLAHMIFWAVGGYGLVWVLNSSRPLALWVLILVIAGSVAGVVVAGCGSARRSLLSLVARLAAPVGRVCPLGVSPLLGV